MAVLDLILYSAIGVSAILTALSKNPLFSSLWLILGISLIGLLLFLNEYYFMAFMQISLYAGGVMVLILFIIMLLGIRRQEASSLNKKILASLIAVMVFWTMLPQTQEAFRPKAFSLSEFGTFLTTNYFWEILTVGMLFCLIVVIAYLINESQNADR
jgi:NADH-quinone oxidoreductase subunit J